MNNQDINTIYMIVITHLFNFSHYLSLATIHIKIHTLLRTKMHTLPLYQARAMESHWRNTGVITSQTGCFWGMGTCTKVGRHGAVTGLLGASQRTGGRKKWRSCFSVSLGRMDGVQVSVCHHRASFVILSFSHTSWYWLVCLPGNGAASSAVKETEKR